MSPSLVPSLLTSIPLFVLTSLPHLAIAIQETNVTLDDTDPSLSYRGTWVRSGPTELSYQGTHQYSLDLAASATLSFIGIAVYMLSPKWPYQVNAYVSLDGGPAVTIDLLDPSHTTSIADGPETLKYDVVWNATSLTNTPHTVVVYKSDSAVIVDGFIYTQTSPDEPSSSSSSATSPNASSSETSVAQSTSSNSKTLPIALGTTFGVLALLATVAVIVFLRKRQEKQLLSISNTGDISPFAPHFQSTNGGSGDSPSMAQHRNAQWPNPNMGSREKTPFNQPTHVAASTASTPLPPPYEDH